MAAEAGSLAERRAHPRHKVDLRKFLVVGGQRIPVMDISWGGICFYATRPWNPETTIGFEHGPLVVQAQVLACELPGSEAHPDYPYRVRCRFAEEPHHPDIEALMEAVLDAEGVGADV